MSLLTISVGLDEHKEAVDRMQRSNKTSAKVLKAQLREIALLTAYRHLHSDPMDLVACVHRDEGDVEFMNILANQLCPQVSTILGLVYCLEIDQTVTCQEYSTHCAL